MELGPLIALATPIVAAIVQLVRPRFGTSPQRRQINRDLDLYERLPEDSEARNNLMDRIEQALNQLLSDESSKRRDNAGVAMGLVLVGLGLILGYTGWTASSWVWIWWIGAALTGLIGFLVVLGAVEKTERDDRGNVLRHNQEKS